MLKKIVKIVVKQKGRAVLVTMTRTDGYKLESRTYGNASLIAFGLLGYALSGADIMSRKESARSAVYEILPPRAVPQRIKTLREYLR